MQALLRAVDVGVVLEVLWQVLLLVYVELAESEHLESVGHLRLYGLVAGGR